MNTNLLPVLAAGAGDREMGGCIKKLTSLPFPALCSPPLPRSSPSVSSPPSHPSPPSPLAPLPLALLHHQGGLERFCSCFGRPKHEGFNHGFPFLITNHHFLEIGQKSKSLIKTCFFWSPPKWFEAILKMCWATKT